MQAIFFDMDGTLLPMDIEGFMKTYFKGLCGVLCPLGVQPDKLVETVWAGTKAMVMNDGAMTNEQRFWQVFSQMTGLDAAPFIPAADGFYTEGFRMTKANTGENPLAVEAVRIAREKSGCVILATNPLFPMPGQVTRMGFVGLTPADFDHVTAYGNSRFCKPNPEYYLQLCREFSLDPAQCLMIGNDEREDVYAASQAGMQGYLVTDGLIPCKEHPWNGPRGTFAEMVGYLKSL